ncbi:MAG TPA: serine/threonine-protein phosphatase [Gammaproteobacteria bacterium]|nr:serine/threonine-protein phosphatase [Gammaproteobacteria bacterium]
MAAWVHNEGMAQGCRARQEDDYGVCELPQTLGAGDLLLVLADGMGGERGGARASALAVRSFITTYDRVPATTIPERLARTLTEVNTQMAREAATDPEELNGMGCTLLAVVLAEEGLYWISVGDSPLWLWRRGRLYRLNQDHAYRSVLAYQVSHGQISAEVAAHHPDRNALMSAVTGDALDLIDLSQQAHTLWNNDQILLASDGILTLDEREISAILTHQRADETPCQALLAAITAHQRPHQDNITIVWACSANRSPNEPWWHHWWALLGAR